MVRRAAVLGAPSSATGTQRTLLSVLAEARGPWVSSAVSAGVPPVAAGGGSRTSLLRASSPPRIQPGTWATLEVPAVKCSSPPFPLWARWWRLLLDRAGVGCFQNPPRRACLVPLCLKGPRGPVWWASLSLLHLRRLELSQCLPSPLPAPLDSFFLSGTRRPPGPHRGPPARPCCCSVTQLCPALCGPTDCSTPGSSVLHCPWEFAHTPAL